tara:strand:- start:842 stop:1624 length:783 start_codon:yes stop_codon:yes gene_type:complete
MVNKIKYLSVNWIGAFTLFKKENHRFLKVYQQTVLAPAFTAFLFFLVINLAFEDRSGLSHKYSEFLAPGLIIMSMMQNAFANTSSSLLSSKIAGNIVDLLMPPFSSHEIIVSYLFAAVIRAFLVGFITLLVMLPFVEIYFNNIFFILIYSFFGSSFLALLGIIAGIWAEKFDNMSGITNFIITPLTFLSGTFYVIDKLPEPFYTLCLFNPFYYIIDGFRFGFTGFNSSNLNYGISLIIMLNIILYFLSYKLLKKGWMLKP